MNVAFAVLLLAHGFAHLVGFVGSFDLMPGKVPHLTTLFGGRVGVGDIGIRAVGIAWLAAALAFGIMAAGALLRADWWPRATALVAVASLALCITGLPEAKMGAAVNLVIIVLVAIVVRGGFRVTA